jgi:hypothetical protein
VLADLDAEALGPQGRPEPARPVGLVVGDLGSCPSSNRWTGRLSGSMAARALAATAGPRWRAPPALPRESPAGDDEGHEEDQRRRSRSARPDRPASQKALVGEPSADAPPEPSTIAPVASLEAGGVDEASPAGAPRFAAGPGALDAGGSGARVRVAGGLAVRPAVEAGVGAAVGAEVGAGVGLAGAVGTGGRDGVGTGSGRASASVSASASVAPSACLEAGRRGGRRWGDRRARDRGSAKPAIARTAMSRAAVLAGFVAPIAGFERTMGADRAPVGDPSVIPP